VEQNYIESTVIVSSSPQIVELVQSCFKHKEQINVISTIEDAELLSIELPELIIIDFTDWGLAFSVLDRIADDPWLHFQNIITIVSGYDISHQSSQVGMNGLATISRYEITENLPTVLTLVRENRQLLFRRSGETVVADTIVGTVSLDNALFQIEAIINLVCTFLYNANKVDDSRKNRLKIALTELLVNSLEHGNCEIGHDEESDWLDSGHLIQELIAQKIKDPKIGSRKITFHYKINEYYSEFTIEDEGAGFKWEEYTESSESRIYTSHNGRGITMASASASLIEYSGKGNKVRCVIDHQDIVSNFCPAVFIDITPEQITEGTILLRQGDESNYLYFIQKGQFIVSVNDKPIAILTPEDIFMGEMSFLLNGKRQATITALSDGSVIRISKREFISVIRKYPYYSLYLSRLLAERLVRRSR